VRTLRPFLANITKRQVKAPKVYITDSGILHTLLGATTQRDLDRHPKVGASWEGFLLESAIRALRARLDQCFYWATHAGAELDLLVANGSRRRGIEFKRTTAPSITPSMRRAVEDLKLSRLDVVHAGTESYQLHRKIRAVAAHNMVAELTGRS
jgi:predicted AAA+ superfamily ATPase